MTEKEAKSISVNDLELSARALNCLRNADIETVYQMATFTKDRYWKVRNFGPKSLAEVEAKIRELGLHMGMEKSDWDDYIIDPRLELQGQNERWYKNFSGEDLSHFYTTCYEILSNSSLKKSLEVLRGILSEICFRDSERALQKKQAELKRSYDEEIRAANIWIKSLETQIKKLKVAK